LTIRFKTRGGNAPILRTLWRKDLLEREERLGIVLLGRPYHNDPGINHEILEEFQKLGYRSSPRIRCRSTRTFSGGFSARKSSRG
jgi:hypothetical protein